MIKLPMKVKMTSNKDTKPNQTYIEEYLNWRRSRVEKYPIWLQEGYVNECNK